MHQRSAKRKNSTSVRNGLLKARKYFIARIEAPESVEKKMPGSLWKDIVKDYPFLSKQGTIRKIEFLEDMLMKGGHKVSPYHITKGGDMSKRRNRAMSDLGIRDGAMLFIDYDKVAGPLKTLVDIEDEMNYIGFPVDRVTERFTIPSAKIARVYRTHYGGFYKDVDISSAEDISPEAMKRRLIDNGMNGYSHYVILNTDSEGKPIFNGMIAGVMFLDILVTVNRHGLIVSEEMPIGFMAGGGVALSIKRVSHKSPEYGKALIIETEDGFFLHMKKAGASPGQWIKDVFPSIDAMGPSLESYFGEHKIIDL